MSGGYLALCEGEVCLLAAPLASSVQQAVQGSCLRHQLILQPLHQIGAS